MTGYLQKILRGWGGGLRERGRGGQMGGGGSGALKFCPLLLCIIISVLLLLLLLLLLLIAFILHYSPLSSRLIALACDFT